MPVFHFRDPATGRDWQFDAPTYEDAQRRYQELQGGMHFSRSPGAQSPAGMAAVVRQNPPTAQDAAALQQGGLRGVFQTDPLGLGLNQPRPAPQGMEHTLPQPAQDWQTRPLNPEFNRQAALTAAQGATFGFADEIAGLAGGIGGAIDPNRTFAEGYAGARDPMLDDVDAFRNQDPGMALATETAGALMAGGAGLVRQAPRVAAQVAAGGIGRTVGSTMARMGLAGSAYGALYGLGTGDTIEERLEGAGLQGAFGAGAGMLFGIPLGWLAGRSVARQAGQAGESLATVPLRATREGFRLPQSHPLKAGADAAYDAVRSAGVAIAPQEVNALRQRLLAVGQRQHGLTQENGGLWAVLNRIELNPVSGNAAFFLDDVDILRQQIRASARNDAEGLIADGLVREIDRFVSNLTPQQIVVMNPAYTVDEAVEMLSQARAAWRDLRKAEAVAEAFYRATVTGGPGAGTSAAIRTQFQRLARDEDFMRGLSSSERDAILGIANVGPSERWLSAISHLVPSPGWGALAGGGLGFVASQGNPLWTTAAAVVPGVARGLLGAGEEGIRSRAAMNAELLFRTRGQPPQVPLILNPAAGMALGGVMPGLNQYVDLTEERRAGVPGGIPPLGQIPR